MQTAIGSSGAPASPGATIGRASSLSKLSQASLRPLSGSSQGATLSRAGCAALVLPASGGEAGVDEEDDGIRQVPGGPRYRVGPRVRPAQGLARERAIYVIREMEDKKAVHHAEAFDNCVHAMTQFPSDVEVQTKGCFAMAYNSVTNSRKVLRAGGLEAVLAAMKRFPKEERLQQEACECLRYLTVRGDDMKRVLQAGGQEALFAAMRNNDKALWVQQEACGALKNIAAREGQAVLNAGGLEQVMKVMDMCPRYSWAQMWGCQAMRRFAEHDARRVDDAGGFSKVGTAMQKHERSDLVQSSGSEALKLMPGGGRL